MKLKLLDLEFKPRLYQELIANTAIHKNTICILPTGLGKTYVAILVAAYRLEKFPKSKMLMVAPTRPLVNQHMKTFKKYLIGKEDDFVSLTGKIHADNRKIFYERGKLFFATPQLIRNDVKNGILDLKEFSLLVVDECVLGDTKIRLWDGELKTIKDIVNQFENGKEIWVSSYNQETKTIEPKKVIKAHKIPNKEKILEIFTERDEKLKLTPDHPILTLNNGEQKWIETKKLKEGDLISFKEPKVKEKLDGQEIISKKDIIETYCEKQQKFTKIYKESLKLRKELGIGSLKISKILGCCEGTIRNYINLPHQKPRPIRTIEKLEKIGIMPLNYSNPRLIFITRIFGHIFGDGYLRIVNREPEVLGFSGRIKNLKVIQDDIECLEFSHSSIYSRKTSSKVRNRSGKEHIIKGETNSFTSTDSGLVRLIYKLGAPSGRKSDIVFILPNWLLNAPMNIKSEFLSSLVGSDGYVPLNVKDSRIFFVSRLVFYKNESLKENGMKYAEQLSKLFLDCGVETNIRIRKGNIRRDGTKTLRFEITISNSRNNLINFLKNIGFRYSKEKQEKALMILRYLEEKEDQLNSRLREYSRVMSFRKNRLSAKEISKKTGIKECTIYSWISGHRKPRYISPNFPTFNEWKKINKSSIYPFKWIKIRKIIPRKNNEYLYDLTVNRTHNFIANGIIIHNCHRSVKNYAYTTVVDEYTKTNPDALVLGLTASPGGIKDKIEEVKENLHCQAVEIRTEKDGDVAPYVQETKVERVYVELPEEFKEIRETLQKIYNQKIYDLLRAKAIPSPKISKKDLLAAQNMLGGEYSRSKDWQALKALLSCAQAIKVSHAIELIETQGVSALNQYLEKLVKDKKSSATRKLLKDYRIKKTIELAGKLREKRVEHPKLKKLLEIVKDGVKKKPNTKIIVFANYRDSVAKIAKLLEKEGIEAREFYGQAKKKGKGLSQKEQIEIINEFELELFNVLIGTSVAEEGLSIPAVDAVIFYEPVPSEIRKIQRSGRTGRTEPGKVVFLITKDTRDEWYYWSAYHKEKRMERILKGMKEENNQKGKKISDYLK